MLRVEGVVKSFDDFKAVNGANLRIGRGEIVAVIGPNGAGKTTLFNLITGQLQRDQGKILFKGEDIGTLPLMRSATGGLPVRFRSLTSFPA